MVRETALFSQYMYMLEKEINRGNWKKKKKIYDIYF